LNELLVKCQHPNPRRRKRRRRLPTMTISPQMVAMPRPSQARLPRKKRKEEGKEINLARDACHEVRRASNVRIGYVKYN